MHLIIDRESTIPLKRQIYNQIKEAILNGDIKLNTSLTATRKLAKELGVSRNIVTEAYDMLCSEGYTRSVVGSGIYVNSSIRIDRPTIKSPQVKISKGEDYGYAISFRSGTPNIGHFPESKWLQCYKDAVTQTAAHDLGYGNQSGHISLRKTLSEYLYRTRGIHCHEDQIIVTSGAIPALFLLVQHFSKQSGAMLVEDPINNVIINMLDFNNVNTIHQPVDEQGIDPEKLPQDIKLSSILTTPSHQYPMGGVLSISRRIQLIRYARNHDCYIIEDDYDSEFRYTNAPVESLHELDPERVIYVSSFSKIFLPSLRLGYMVLPEKLIKTIHDNKRLVDIHCPTFDQIAMKNFIERGYLEQHLNKMRKLYYTRQQAMINALKENFGEQVTIIGREAGMHLVADFSVVDFTKEIIDSVNAKNLFIMPVSDHSYYPENHRTKLIFGYGHLNEDDIYQGIHMLKSVLDG